MSFNLKIFFSSFVVYITFLSLVFSGCVEQEKPKKVSLYSRASGTPSSTGDNQKNTIQFGFDFNLDPKEEVNIYTPFIKYLEEKTGSHFHLKFTEKNEDTVENLSKGVIHFALVNPLSYVAGREKYGNVIRYLASGVNKEGDPGYQAIIFTKQDSKIRDIEDIKGRSFAFGAKMSTQGHLIPREMLEDAGIYLKDLSHYVYTGSHIDIVASVLNGEADAGGMQDTLANNLAAEGKIKILKISKPYPSSLIAYNSSVDKNTVDAVRSALLALEPLGRHKEALTGWEKTEMPFGFTMVNESEFYKVAVLARKYGLLTK